MRIRTIKPEFWTDEKIVQLAPFSRLLFIGLWCMVDDEGRMECSFPRIKMTLFPADNIDVAEICADLRKFALIETYIVEGKEYLQVIGFSKHQRVDQRRKSLLPAPMCGSLPGKKPRKGREGKGKEWNGMDGKVESESASQIPTPETHPQLFRWLKGCDKFLSDKKFMASIGDVMDNLQAAYPEADFSTIPQEAHSWLLANPHKPKKNLLSFFRNWISRQAKGWPNKNADAPRDSDGRVAIQPLPDAKECSGGQGNPNSCQAVEV